MLLVVSLCVTPLCVKLFSSGVNLASVDKGKNYKEEIIKECIHKVWRA
jgi:hypothetical protein